jgi:hypothetical protein
MHPVILRALIFFICLGFTAVAQRPSGTTTSQKPGATKATNAEPDTTAIGAVALLPKDVAARVARIEGPDGKPFPERWYILVHDPSAPRGLREYVVSGGKPLTNRALSQFADTISAEEVVGAAALKLNNDEAAGIAAQFARHNNQQLGGARYEFYKSQAPAAPVWRLTCFDPKGELLGTIILHATKGTLLSFQGFESSPMPVDAQALAASQTSAGPNSDSSSNKPESTRKSAKRASSESTQSSSRGERANPPGDPPVAVRAVPIRRPLPPPREGPVDRVGSMFRRIFRD